MLNTTEWQVIMHALDVMPTDRVEFWLDDDGELITPEWLEKLGAKLEKMAEGAR